MQSTATLPQISAAIARARLVGAVVALGDRVVLRAVDLEVAPGITILRGPNGAGKTTALRALAGLVPLLRGSAEIDGDFLSLGHRPQLLHGLTARENLAFLAAFRGTPPAIGPALRKWGLESEADRPVEQLSAGQRRRAALARLDSEPCDVWLLDEPFAELDEDASGILRATLRDSAQRGAAILIASHGHAELDAFATRVRLMRDGTIDP